MDVGIKHACTYRLYVEPSTIIMLCMYAGGRLVHISCRKDFAAMTASYYSDPML